MSIAEILKEDNLFDYQKRLIKQMGYMNRIFLIVRMGAGKTVSILTHLRDLKREDPSIKSLIIAPPLVAKHSWPDEIERWEHLSDLSYVLVHGRTRQKAIEKDKDIYISTYDMFDFLVKNNLHKKIDVLVLDESTKIKNRTSKRFKLLKKMIKQRVSEFKKVILATGIPSASGTLKEIWPQTFALDSGYTLGRTWTKYIDRYYNLNPYAMWDLKLKPLSKKIIASKIKHYIPIIKDDEYRELPPINHIPIYFELNKKIYEKYKILEKHFIIELEENTLAVGHAGIKANKMKQLISGEVYTGYDFDENENQIPEEVHDFKKKVVFEFLDNIVNETKENFILFYDFIFEKEYLSQKEYISFISEKEAINKWNQGEIRVLAAHPLSASHGLNLQRGGRNILWLSPKTPGAYETYAQANARLHREGQQKNVNIYTIICKKTIDEIYYHKMGDHEIEVKDLKKHLLKTN